MDVRIVDCKYGLRGVKVYRYIELPTIDRMPTMSACDLAKRSTQTLLWHRASFIESNSQPDHSCSTRAKQFIPRCIAVSSSNSGRAPHSTIEVATRRFAISTSASAVSVRLYQREYYTRTFTGCA